MADSKRQIDDIISRSMGKLLGYIKAIKIKRRYLVYSILIFVTVFHAVLLFPEIKELSPDINDDVFQYCLCVSMRGEIQAGGNPIDHWVPYWTMGYPVFHHYQHLPHLVVVTMYYLLLKTVSMFLIYHLILYLLLVFYPLALYFSLRKMGFSDMASACAALFSLGLSNINGYGFELGSFIWRGSGMYTQLWAMFLFPLTISSIYNTINENKGYSRSVMLLFCLTLSQVMFALMAAITSFLFIFKSFEWKEIWERLKRLAVILAVFMIAIAYLFIPMQMDSAYHAHSTYDFPEKWDSYGLRYIVTHFLNGDILDHGRMPIVTVLAVMGVIFSLSRRAFRYRWAAAASIAWFLLYFGRPTWGRLMDLLPMSSDLHIHRFVTMVHFFGAIMAGMILSVLYRKIGNKFGQVLAVCLLIIAATPIFWDRFLFLQLNNRWIRENSAAYQKEEPALRSVLDTIKKSPPGRTYPGRRANWGGNFKLGQTAVMYFFGPEEMPTLSYLPFTWSLASDFSENFNEYDKAQYNLFNVKYYLAGQGKDIPLFLKEIKKSGRFRLYKADTTGYFDLVESPIAMYADKNSIWNLMFLWQRSSMVSKKQYVTIFFDRKYHKGYQDYLVLKDRWEFWRENPIRVSLESIQHPSGEPVNVFSMQDVLQSARYPQVSPGIVVSEKPGKNVFTGNVKADKDCLLLFKMTYHPGWHAYIDGKEKDKVILSPGFIGVKINKGVHSVKFEYRAQWWKMPLFFFGLLSLAMLFLWERKRK